MHQPLDMTGTTEPPGGRKIMAHTGKPVTELMGRADAQDLKPELFERKVRVITVKDIIPELENIRPGPTTGLKVARFNGRRGRHQGDLREGMEREGTVITWPRLVLSRLGAYQDGLACQPAEPSLHGRARGRQNRDITRCV
jgi:uncharacterized protein